MKRIFHYIMTVICGAVFIISLCSLETLHPLVISAAFLSELWLMYAAFNTGAEKEREEDVYSDR